MANLNYVFYTKFYKSVPLFFIQQNSEGKYYSVALNDTEYIVLFRNEHQAKLFRKEIGLEENSVILSKKFDEEKAILITNVKGFIKDIKLEDEEENKIHLNNFYKRKLKRLVENLDAEYSEIKAFHLDENEKEPSDKYKSLLVKTVEIQGSIFKLKKEFNFLLEV